MFAIFRSSSKRKTAFSAWDGSLCQNSAIEIGIARRILTIVPIKGLSVPFSIIEMAALLTPLSRASFLWE